MNMQMNESDGDQSVQMHSGNDTSDTRDSTDGPVRDTVPGLPRR
jgi:hypothetical protein